MNGIQPAGPQSAAMARPQVGIERLPTRRMSNEPRESMNCKSCRKRKVWRRNSWAYMFRDDRKHHPVRPVTYLQQIKCNRLRPACEACQVFQCPCIYGAYCFDLRTGPPLEAILLTSTAADAVPKKRGPKTDVLEALLKRVDGLEAKLKEKNAGEQTPTEPAPSLTAEDASSSSAPEPSEDNEPSSKRLALDLALKQESAVFSPGPIRYGQSTGPPGLVLTSLSEPSPPTVQPETLIDTYFARFHAKPFHILDESSVRQRLQLNQLPGYLVQSICAVAARHEHSFGPISKRTHADLAQTCSPSRWLSSGREIERGLCSPIPDGTGHGRAVRRRASGPAAARDRLYCGREGQEGVHANEYVPLA